MSVYESGHTLMIVVVLAHKVTHAGLTKYIMCVVVCVHVIFLNECMYKREGGEGKCVSGCVHACVRACVRACACTYVSPLPSVLQ